MLELKELAAFLNQTYPAAGDTEARLAWGLNALEEAQAAGASAVQLTAFNPEDVILSEYFTRNKRALPALFLDTGKHFPETLCYARETADRYGFARLLKTLSPDGDTLAKIDPEGDLWSVQVNRCCHLRKTMPLEKELTAQSYGALITGLRQEQTPERADMTPAQTDEKGRLKLSPLFGMSKADRDAYMRERGLPFHPLYGLGYPSVGCAPCTTPVFPGEHERAGRWRHTRIAATASGEAAQGKTECGLHVASPQA